MCRANSRNAFGLAWRRAIADENHFPGGLGAGDERPRLDAVGGKPLGQVGVVAPEHDFGFDLGHVGRIGHVELDVAAGGRRALLERGQETVLARRTVDHHVLGEHRHGELRLGLALGIGNLDGDRSVEARETSVAGPTT